MIRQSDTLRFLENQCLRFVLRLVFFFSSISLYCFFKRLFGASVLLFYYTNIIVSFRYNYKDEDLKKKRTISCKTLRSLQPMFRCLLFSFPYILLYQSLFPSPSLRLPRFISPLILLYFSLLLFFFKQASRLNVLRVLFASKILYHKIM